MMIEKQWLSYFVSWSHELWPENVMVIVLHIHGMP
jgi:hypothetical protein